jgi:hypothetical protein
MINFIVLGPQRSGTTVVSLALVEHPDILFYGELFNHEMIKRTSIAAREILGSGVNIPPELSSYGVAACQATENGYEYLDRFYASDVPFMAIGYKMLYTNAIRGIPNRAAWDYIVDHPEIKIIHLQRENLLEIVCSIARANISKIWHTYEPVESEGFSLTPAECLTYFKSIHRIPARAQRILKTHQVLDIEYNQVAEDFQESMSRIFSFLDVNTEIKTSHRLVKISRFQPNEEIINYQELKEHFKDTQYGKYFNY